MTSTASRPAGAASTLQRCAVVGHPVEHSLSPELHAAAYRVLGLDWRYDRVDVEPGGFADFVAGLDRAVWRGLSVTMPHKPDVVGLGRPDEAARLTGVANTLVLGATPEDDRSANTDVPGFVIALAERGVQHVDSMLVIGNGATAMSALAAGQRIGARRMAVALRRPDRATDVLALAGRMGVDIDVVPLTDSLPRADLLVSTVPEEGAGVHADRLAQAAPIVFDAIYDPWPTRLAREAAALGATVIDGLELLAAQAIDQVRLMTEGHGAEGAIAEVTPRLLREAGMTELRLRGVIPVTALGD